VNQPYVHITCRLSSGNSLRYGNCDDYPHFEQR